MKFTTVHLGLRFIEMAVLKNTSVSSSAILPVGTTAERPSSPSNGMIRFNTETQQVEYYFEGNWTILTNAERRYGSGSAGPANLSGQPNSYAHMTDSFRAETDNTMTVSSTSGMSVGDLAFIYQTQEYDPWNTAGNYEINTISNISGNTLTFKYNFLYNYRSGRYNQTDQTSRNTQVVTCPPYESITLSGLVEAKSWDGQSGGILFLVANGSYDGNGFYASAWGRGYRGGRGSANSDSQSVGYAGESVRGELDNTAQDNFTGGAGSDGSENRGGESGGSASHVTAGGGGTDGAFGATYVVGDENLGQMFFGGGGGRGGDNDDRGYDEYVNHSGNERSGNNTNWFNDFGDFTTLVPPWGANRHQTGPDPFACGGGIVVICAPNISNLRATARGMPTVSGDPGAGEKGGMGAAGSILVRSESGRLAFNALDVRGNPSATQDFDPVGPSGDGRIKIELRNGTAYSGSPSIDSGTFKVQEI